MAEYLNKISTLKQDMINNLHKVIKIIGENYTNTLSSNTYHPSIFPKTLGEMLSGIYEDGVLLELPSSKKYYLYLHDKILDLQTFNFSANIRDIFLDKEIYELEMVKTDDILSVAEQIVYTQSLKDIYKKMPIFNEFKEKYQDLWAQYINVYNDIYDSNKPKMLEIVAQHKETMESMDYEFVNAENSLDILKLFVEKNGGNIVEIKFENPTNYSLKFNDVKNYFYEKDGVYFNPSDEWFNSNNSSIKTMFLKHLLEFGNDYIIPRAFLEEMPYTITKRVDNVDLEIKQFHKILETLDDDSMKNLVQSANISALDMIIDVCNDINRDYKHITGGVDLEPKVLGNMLIDIYKQGFILSDDKNENFYLYINDGILDLQNLSHQKEFSIDTINEFDKLKYFSQYVPYNLVELETLSNIQEQLKIVHPYSFGLLDKVFNESVNTFKVWQSVKNSNANMYGNLIDEFTKIHINNNGFRYFDENKKMLPLLEELAKLDGGKVVLVETTNKEYNYISEYFYEKNGLYFSPNREFYQPISFSSENFLMQRIFDFGKVSKTSNILKDLSNIETKEYLSETKTQNLSNTIENTQPFNVIEKPLNEKSFDELLSLFKSLNEQMDNVRKAMETKVKGLSNE